MFKNYKKLYKIELNNRKLIEERYNELKFKDEEWQKKYVAKLRLEVRNQREKIAKLTFDLEDTTGFLEQERACSDALREKIKKLKKDLKRTKMKVSENQVKATSVALKEIAKENNVSVEEIVDMCINEGEKKNE